MPKFTEFPPQTEAAVSAAAHDESRAIVRWFGVALFTSIFLQRFALPGSGGIALNMFVTFGMVAALALRGSLMVDPVRAGLLFVFAGGASLSVLVNSERASINSLLLVTIMYTPFIFSLRSTGDVFMKCLRGFQKMVLVCAVVGIVQYLVQFVLHGPLIFTFDSFVPAGWLVPNFNTANQLYYGSTLYKSNGGFLLEPSMFSQYLSEAILIEMIYFRSTLKLIVFGVALLFTFSGTGPIMLAIVLPWVILHRRAYGLLAGLVVFAGVALATGNLWHMDVLLRRSAEFGEADTSATARFIAGIWVIADNMRWTVHDVLFGFGPGSYLRFANRELFEAHDPVWAKLLFEYGSIGLISFSAFFMRALFHKPASGWLAAALGIGFLVFGGEFLDPRLNTLMLVFCVLPKRLEAAPGLLWPPPAEPPPDRDAAMLSTTAAP